MPAMPLLSWRAMAAKPSVQPLPSFVANATTQTLAC
jgi:hypothetical protein